jgi:hypothetical protein
MDGASVLELNLALFNAGFLDFKLSKSRCGEANGHPSRKYRQGWRRMVIPHSPANLTIAPV